jgi:hypothetical protein
MFSQSLLAQCGSVGTDNFVSSQSQLETYEDCEIIYGNLFISSSNITSLSPLNGLAAIQGNLFILNTSVTDLSPLSSLYNAVQITIQGNTNLNSCCEILQFKEASELGTIMSLAYSNNGNNCNEIEDIMMACLGYIEGCTDAEALNYNELATEDDGSCEYFCPESIDDIVDYNCTGEAYPTLCEAQIINEPSDGAGHYNNPIGLCYDESPPSSGPHRPMWGRWGEYDYMPPQRYIHNLEHGGIALLYNPCVGEDVINQLRTIACSRPDDDGGEFRWVLTPYVDLPTNIAIVAWEWKYLNNCIDVDEINAFIDEHYRNAPEDFYYNGSYDSLYVGKCEAYGCTDPNAINYDGTALYDNASCEYVQLDTQLVSFKNGWGMISSYITPVNNDIESIFNNHINDMVIIKNNNGEVFLPAWGANWTLNNFTIGEGYYLKMQEAGILEVVGEQALPENNPIELAQGWNTIGYLREDAADIELVLQDITEQLIIVKDELGNVYFPEWNFNNIDLMKPGKAYQLKTSSAATLEYIPNDQEY